MILDTHFHIWQKGKNGAIWPTEDWAPIFRDFDLAEYEQTARDNGVLGAVVVQASPTDADTDYICAQVADSDFVRAIIGYVDFDSPDAVARISELRQNPKMRGFRPMKFTGEADWLVQPQYAPVFDAIEEADMIFEALVMTPHLPALGELAAQRSDLPIILNHAAMPDIEEAQFPDWKDGISQVAASPNTWCKLSGLWTRDEHVTVDDEIEPYASHVIESFGTERVMFGSDWPVLGMHGDYRSWVQQCRRMTEQLGPQAQAAIFHDNAAKLYRIG